MKTLSGEFRKVNSVGFCSNCRKFSFFFKRFDNKDKSLPLLVLWKNIPTGSYAQCPKCYYKIAYFKDDVGTLKNDYIEVNSDSNNTENSNVDIIKIDKLKSYSVADELLKWVKLKEDGHITEQEFDDARKKLLKRD